MASKNSCKSLIGIPRSDQNVWPFRTVSLVWRGQTGASPSSDSRSITRKMTSKKSCKSLIKIQQSDQKLWPFQTINLVWRDQTSFSPSIDSTSTPWRRASGNSCKILIAINSQIKSYGPSEPSLSNLYSGLARPDLCLTKYRFHIHSIE
jgi:hypothetical protein